MHMEKRGSPADLLPFAFPSILCSWLCFSLFRSDHWRQGCRQICTLTGEATVQRPQGYSIQGKKCDNNARKLIQIYWYLIIFRGVNVFSQNTSPYQKYALGYQMVPKFYLGFSLSYDQSALQQPKFLGEKNNLTHTYQTH